MSYNPQIQQEYNKQFVINTPPGDGPRPWCRICSRPVSSWQWENTKVGWIFTVKCHDDQMSGMVDHPAPINNLRLEVFCYSDPHMDKQFIWWVNPSGSMLQDSYEYLSWNKGPPSLITKLRPYILVVYFIWAISSLICSIFYPMFR